MRSKIVPSGRVLLKLSLELHELSALVAEVQGITLTGLIRRAMAREVVEASSTSGEVKARLVELRARKARSS